MSNWSNTKKRGPANPILAAEAHGTLIPDNNTASRLINNRKQSGGLHDLKLGVGKTNEEAKLGKALNKDLDRSIQNQSYHSVQHPPAGQGGDPTGLRASATQKGIKKLQNATSQFLFQKQRQYLQSLFHESEPLHTLGSESNLDDSVQHSARHKAAKWSATKQLPTAHDTSELLNKSGVRLSKHPKQGPSGSSHMSLSQVFHLSPQAKDVHRPPAKQTHNAPHPDNSSGHLAKGTDEQDNFRARSPRATKLTFQLNPGVSKQHARQDSSTMGQVMDGSINKVGRGYQEHAARKSVSDINMFKNVADGIVTTKRIDESPQRRHTMNNFQKLEASSSEDRDTPQLGGNSNFKASESISSHNAAVMGRYANEIPGSPLESSMTTHETLFEQYTQGIPIKNKPVSLQQTKLSQILASDSKKPRKKSHQEGDEPLDTRKNMRTSKNQGIKDIFGDKLTSEADESHYENNSSIILDKSGHLKSGKASGSGTSKGFRKSVAGKSTKVYAQQRLSTHKPLESSASNLDTSSIIMEEGASAIGSELNLPSTPKHRNSMKRATPLKSRPVDTSIVGSMLDLDSKASPGDVSMVQLKKAKPTTQVSQSNVKTVKKSLKPPQLVHKVVPVKDVSPFDPLAGETEPIETEQESHLNRSVMLPAPRKQPLLERFELETKEPIEHNKSMELPKHFDGDTNDSGDQHHLKVMDEEDEEIDAEAKHILEKVHSCSAGAKLLAKKVQDFFKQEEDKDIPDPDAPVLETNLNNLRTRPLKVEDFASKIEHYELLKCVGQGAFAKVHLATQVLTGVRVAVKTINKKSLAQDDSVRCKIENEIELMKMTTKCPRLVRLWEYFETKDYMFLVTEYASDGDLQERVNREGPLKEDTAKEIFHDLMEAVEFLHKHRIVHRDIKLENILLAKGRAKLADLGISKRVPAGTLLGDSCGTPASQAPETISGQPYDGYEADVWGLGVALYQMIFGRVPFRADSIEELYRKIKNDTVEFPAKAEASPALKDLIRRLLQKDPKRRLTLAQAKEHLWLEKRLPTTKQAQVQALKSDKLALTVISKLGYQEWMIRQGIKSESLCYGVACYYALRESF